MRGSTQRREIEMICSPIDVCMGIEHADFLTERFHWKSSQTGTKLPHVYMVFHFPMAINIDLKNCHLCATVCFPLFLALFIFSMIVFLLKCMTWNSYKLFDIRDECACSYQELLLSLIYNVKRFHVPWGLHLRVYWTLIDKSQHPSLWEHNVRIQDDFW